MARYGSSEPETANCRSAARHCALGRPAPGTWRRASNIQLPRSFFFTTPPLQLDPCAGQGNNGPPAFVPRWPVKVRAAALHRRPCSMDGTFHGLGLHYLMCDYCLDSRLDQAWSADIVAHVTTLPPALPPFPPRAAIQNANIWNGFLTHLCRSCEILELRVLHHHLTNPASTPPGNVAQMIGWPDIWPHISCTCLEMHADDARPDQDLCVRHRRQIMVPRHRERQVTKQQNDIWLRETARKPNDARAVIWLDPNTRRGQSRMDDRAKRGIYRACRCGADIKRKAGRAAVVFMCLGCEGIVHHGPRLAWTAGNADAGIATFASDIPGTDTRHKIHDLQLRIAHGDPYLLRRPRT